MTERDGYEPGVPVPEARTLNPREAPVLGDCSPTRPGGAASTVSQLVIASQGG
jgi:hypothetical protein